MMMKFPLILIDLTTLSSIPFLHNIHGVPIKVTSPPHIQSKKRTDSTNKVIAFSFLHQGVSKACKGLK